MTRDGEQVEGYDVFVGGTLGRRAAVARRIGYRVPADEAAAALERLFTTFLRERASSERFSTWVNRVPDALLRDALAGVEV